MKILRYAAHNVLRISDIDLTMDGHNLFLVGGKNDQGKTSAIVALLMALCGRSGMDNWPEVALRDGETDGWVKVDLSGDEQLPSGLKLELHLKRRRNGTVVEEFSLTDGDGRECKEPRTILKRLCEMKGFDPLAFERLGRKEKAALLTKLLGLDFSEQKREHQKLYKEREEVNRDGKNLKARFEAMPKHADAPEQEVSVAELMQEQQRRQTFNEGNKRERDKLPGCERAVSDAVASIQTVEQAIVELERQTALKRDNLTKLADAKAHAESILRAQQETVKVLQDKDVGEVQQQIVNAEAVNKKVRENRQRAETEKELESLRTKSQSLTASMEAIIEAQQKAMQSAKWPVPGLAIDDEGVLFNGLPFEQASKSTRIKTSCKIGMALNPRLRLLVSSEGNDLDRDSLAELDSLLKEGDYQMLLEFVTRSATDEDLCAIVVENGRSKKKA